MFSLKVLVAVSAGKKLTAFGLGWFVPVVLPSSLCSLASR